MMMIRRHRRDRPGQEAFTLIEVLIAISLLAVVLAVIYESFASVMNSTELARESTGELRMRQFLSRNLNANISSITVPPDFLNSKFAIVGTGGNMTSLEFTSTSPLAGTTSLPGIVKRVRYLASSGGSDMDVISLLESDEDIDARLYLECTEVPLTDPSMDEDAFAEDPSEDFFLMEADQQMAPGWSIPIDSFTVRYFDGEEWVEEWDSMALLQVPWAVRIQINFANSEDDRERDVSGNLENADFDMVIPVPTGEGTYSLEDVTNPSQPSGNFNGRRQP